MNTSLGHPDPWAALRSQTQARIALGRAGTGLPTARLLEFRQAHAQARDAVHVPLDLAALQAALQPLGLRIGVVHSRASTRSEYLQRPDWGRRLTEEACQHLQQQPQGADVAIVIADGLSAPAIQSHAAPLLAALLPQLHPLTLAPITLVAQGRVAIGDEVGYHLQAKLVVLLVGERPGLSSPDSLGLYLTYAPAVGLTDERRNCISNVRPEGLPYAAAAAKCAWFVHTALARQLTGVGLKDELPGGVLLHDRDSPPLSNGARGIS
jgi:ethanolamine ammonia-lyase small subunit